MKAFTVTFNGDKDLTKIKFTGEFLQEHVVTKLDILKDSIYELQEIYNKTLVDWTGVEGGELDD